MSDPFDPQAPEDKPRGSQYVSRKDFKVIAIGLFFLALLAWPIYNYMLAQVQMSQCGKNFTKMSLALQNYLSDNDDHFPYAYETQGYQSSDATLRNGYANSWQFQLERYTGTWDVFRCPAADPSENARISNGDIVETSSYGMVNAYSGVAASTIANPDLKVVIAETATNGANGTLDPLPLIGPKDDGFAIGFNNSQDYPDLKTQFATRLAFPNSAKTGLDHQSEARHPNGIHFLMVGGGSRFADGAYGHVIPLGAGFGQWDVPKPVPLIEPKTRGR
jgi:hypothetical protein